MQSTRIAREPVVHAVARLIAERVEQAASNDPVTFAEVVRTNLAEGWSFELPDGGEADAPRHAAGLRLHDADLMRAWEQAQQLLAARS
jgi:hypothetical protein